MAKKDKDAGENTGLPLKPDQQVQELRSQAERVIRQQGALPPVDLENITLEERQKLLYELQVHQVELAMQNEELRASQVGLEDSRSHYFELYDLAPVGYLTVSEQGFITMANLTFATLLGVKRSALDHEPLSRYILKEDQDIYYRHRKILFESGEDQQCELRMIKADGVEFWAKLQANLMQDEAGELQCRVVMSDISERKQAEGILRKTKFTVDKSPLSVFWITPEGMFTYVNDTAVEKLGYTHEELLSMHVWDVDPLYPQERRKEQWNLHQKERKRRVESEHRRRDGTTYPVLINIYHLAFEGQEMEVAVVEDITERKQAEGKIRTLNEELEQRVRDRTIELDAVNKELASFAYSISHDFRAPLRALNAFSASLTEKYGEQLDEQGLHYLNRIHKASLYMSDLVDDLLSLSRVTRADMNRQKVDISQTAAEIIQGLQIAEPERRVKVIVAPSLTAKGDVALLKAALENLIDNAWKFSSKEAQAKIEVGRTTIDGEEAFFVRDNGAGFNMAYAKNLFGAFQRLHGVNEFPGTGIGLATVQRIINRHGGRIWAESEMGKGAIFYFTLPK